jgi:protein-S-isoprenylcysteine O-methyltransferase Ste14
MGWVTWVVGPALAFGGLALVSWAVYIQYTLGKGTPVPAVATKKLVTQGPYAYSRNPMTLGALILYLGIGFWLGSGVVITLCVVVFIILLRFIYIHETRELAQRFGEPYLEYRERTPFLFPRFHLSRKDGK